MNGSAAKKNGEAGYVVLFVSVIVGLLALAMESVFLQVQSTSETDGLVLQKQRIAYLAEGISQIANKFTQDYLLINAAPTSAQLNTYVNGRIAGLSIAPYTLSSLNLTLGAPVFGAIPSGPFVGMDSYQIPLKIEVKMNNAANQVAGELVKTSILAKLTLFQFALFGDLSGAPVYLTPGLDMDVHGRVHANGDFCMGNYGSSAYALQVQRITASGGVRNLRDSSCWASPIGVTNESYVSTDPTDTLFALLKPGAGSGCTNCDGTGLDWRIYAQTVWKGNLLDSAHQVQALKLPLNGTESVQAGVRADMTSVDNAGSLRVLIDPVIAADTPATLDHKFSANSDIRIINGVWYLKDPGNPVAWPGIPVWSDHPGRFLSENEEGIEGMLAVGQDDIRDRWTLAGSPWPATGIPHGYSYYEYDPVTHTLLTDPTGTISYGTLFRQPAATPVWLPGHWADPSSPQLCDSGFSCTNCSATAPLNSLSATSLTCSGGIQPGLPEFLLNATRSGFRDGNVVAVSAGSAATQKARSMILPMNFDVAAFQAALANTLPGELGSYFGAGRFMNRPFNGIVYITQTWKGSMAGLGGSAPLEYPYQGATTDSLQASITSPAQQQALPFPLCSSAAVDLAGGLAGQSFTGVRARFKIPDCKKYSPSYVGIDAIAARPNVVRVINAANISPGTLTGGLTIATNMAAYVVSDVNTSSDTSSPVAAPWVPVLVAADQTMLLSNQWDDRNSRWDKALSALTRMAADTIYNLSLLTGGTGTTPTAWSGGMENLPRYLEKWNLGGVDRTATIRGSLVMGFSSVYFRNPIGPSNPPSWGTVTYLPPKRDFRFDEHLAKFINQPPGSPKFNVYSVQKWTVQ